MNGGKRNRMMPLMSYLVLWISRICTLKPLNKTMPMTRLISSMTVSGWMNII